MIFKYTLIDTIINDSQNYSSIVDWTSASAD